MIVQKGCRTCLHVLASHKPCEDCQPRYRASTYVNYKEATDVEILAERHRQELKGRHIVLGREGEHSVNPKWSIEKARAQLSDRCENVGGLSWRKGDSIFVDKPYDAGYELQYEGGKLMRIFRETRQIPRTLWWSRAEVVEGVS